LLKGAKKDKSGRRRKGAHGGEFERGGVRRKESTKRGGLP